VTIVPPDGTLASVRGETTPSAEMKRERSRNTAPRNPHFPPMETNARIAAPWREDIALRVAHALEQMGVAAAPAPRGLS